MRNLRRVAVAILAYGVHRPHRFLVDLGINEVTKMLQMLDGTSRSCKSHRRRNSAATWAEMSRDQPSATLKEMTRIGFEYCPPSKSSMAFSASTSLSQ
jgi:hypothetical protein